MDLHPYDTERHDTTCHNIHVILNLKNFEK
jgi:hypothetical protein